MEKTCESETEMPSVGFGEAFRVWCKVASLSFGGPAGQIAVMHRILVEEKRWVSENRFLHVNYCMLFDECPECSLLFPTIVPPQTRGGKAGGMSPEKKSVTVMLLGNNLAKVNGSIPT